MESNTSIGTGDRENEQELLLLNEAEHRHGNTLQILSSLVRRSLQDAKTAEAREALSWVSELVETLGRLHGLTREGAQGDMADLLGSMARQWQRICNGHIRIVVEAEPGLKMAQNQHTIVTLIAQELVLNAIKHAFPEQRHGTVHVRLYACGDGNATLEVEDDGVGPRAGRSNQCKRGTDSTVHGRSLTRDLSLFLGGGLQRGQSHTNGGYRVTVCWPL